MFAYDRGWVHKLEEAVMTGLTAEAAVERVQSDTRARMLRQTDPFLRERLHDLDDLANRLMRQLTGRDHAPSRENFRKMPFLSPVRWAQRRFSTTTASACAASCSKRAARIRTSLSWRGRWVFRPSATSKTRPASPIPAMRSSSTGRLAIYTSARFRTWKRPMPSGSACAPAGSNNIAGFATSPASPEDGQEIALFLNAGLSVDLPHIADTGAGGIGLFRTELQFMVAPSFPRTSEQYALYRAVLDAAGSKPVLSGPSISAGTSCCPICATLRRKTPRSAGAPFGSVSTGPACCAPNCGRCFAPAAGASSISCFQ